MQKSNVVFEIEIGHRIISGTRWPISNTVRREGPRYWVATIGLCNGTAIGTQIFSTKKEAIAFASAITDEDLKVYWILRDMFYGW